VGVVVEGDTLYGAARQSGYEWDGDGVILIIMPEQEVGVVGRVVLCELMEVEKQTKNGAKRRFG